MSVDANILNFTLVDTSHNNGNVVLCHLDVDVGPIRLFHLKVVQRADGSLKLYSPSALRRPQGGNAYKVRDPDIEARLISMALDAYRKAGGTLSPAGATP